LSWNANEGKPLPRGSSTTSGGACSRTRWATSTVRLKGRAFLTLALYTPLVFKTLNYPQDTAGYQKDTRIKLDKVLCLGPAGRLKSTRVKSSTEMAQAVFAASGANAKVRRCSFTLSHPR